MVEEFDFYRKVRAYYCNVKFEVLFSYRFAHRLDKKATAMGTFSCSVNAHTQTVEYTMQLKTDVIERPHSESGALLFSTVYEAIPPQVIEFKDYQISKIRYKVPIDYDWQQFIREGAEAAMNVQTLGALIKKWKLSGEAKEQVEAHLKVIKVSFQW